MILNTNLNKHKRQESESQTSNYRYQEEYNEMDYENNYQKVIQGYRVIVFLIFIGLQEEQPKVLIVRYLLLRFIVMM